MDPVDVALYFAYALLGAVVVASLLFFYVGRSTQSLKKTSIAIALLGGIFLLSYLLADGSHTSNTISPSALRWVSGMLTTMYWLLGFCAAGIVFLEMRRLVQRF